MKILIASTIRRKIDSRITASRSRIIYDLASGLIKKGHKVTILGTADSKVKGAMVIPVIPKGFLELAAKFENPFYAEISYLMKGVKILEKISKDYDIIHNHAFPEIINLTAIKNIKTPMVTTIHLAVDKQYYEALSYFPEAYLIYNSYSAKKLDKAKLSKVVYLGIDTNIYKFNPKKEDYLLWIGRLGKAKDKKGRFYDGKGVRWAIKLARATNSKLLLGGNVEDVEFYNKDVKLYLNEKIKWIGPISFQQPLSKEKVASLMGKAKVFLMMSSLNESFGLVVAEAMACGTPVIGFNSGAANEIIENGKTGFVINQNDGLLALKKALKKINQIKPLDCRARVEEKFSLNQMVNNYEKIYQKIIQGDKK